MVLSGVHANHLQYRNSLPKVPISSHLTEYQEDRRMKNAQSIRAWMIEKIK